MEYLCLYYIIHQSKGLNIIVVVMTTVICAAIITILLNALPSLAHHPLSLSVGAVKTIISGIIFSKIESEYASLFVSSEMLRSKPLVKQGLFISITSILIRRKPQAAMLVLVIIYRSVLLNDKHINEA